MTNSTRSGSSSRCAAPVHIPLARRRQSSHPQRPKRTRHEKQNFPLPDRPLIRLTLHIPTQTLALALTSALVTAWSLRAYPTAIGLGHASVIVNLLLLTETAVRSAVKPSVCVRDFLSRPPGPIHKPARCPGVSRPRHRITGAGYTAQPAGVRVRSLRGSPRCAWRSSRLGRRRSPTGSRGSRLRRPRSTPSRAPSPSRRWPRCASRRRFGVSVVFGPYLPTPTRLNGSCTGARACGIAES